MTRTEVIDPRVVRFRDALRIHYGARIERMVLFGSRARGDGHRRSDYDIAIFLQDIGSEWEEIRKITDIRFETLMDPETVHVVLRQAGSWDERSPFMSEIRRDALDL